ncbi:MAG: Ig-like domain-containing protein [Lachnospiraceae bacterium]|nr:Ig-like domain-containing protein [Lachnospiraceae bacterium]
MKRYTSVGKRRMLAVLLSGILLAGSVPVSGEAWTDEVLMEEFGTVDDGTVLADPEPENGSDVLEADPGWEAEVGAVLTEEEGELDGDRTEVEQENNVFPAEDEPDLIEEVYVEGAEESVWEDGLPETEGDAEAADRMDLIEDPMEEEALLEVEELANGEVPLDSEHFPDDEFRRMIRLYDANANGVLGPAEISSITSISIVADSTLEPGETEITSVEGIEYLTALTFFKWDRSKRSNRFVCKIDLTNLRALRILQLNNLILKELDLSACTELVYLGVVNTSIVKLDLTKNKKLDTAYLPNNEFLTTVIVKGLEYLQILNVSEGIGPVDVTETPYLKFAVERKENCSYDPKVVVPTYVEWICGSDHAVVFSANGGSGSMPGAMVERGKTYRLPECTFTAPVGGKFSGYWEHCIDRETYKRYKPGDQVLIEENAVFRPIWNSDSTTFTIEDLNIDVRRPVAGDVPAKKGELSVASNRFSVQIKWQEFYKQQAVDMRSTRFQSGRMYRPVITLIPKPGMYLEKASGGGLMINGIKAGEYTTEEVGAFAFVGSYIMPQDRYYDLYVGSTRVGEKNSLDVLGDGGSVKYYRPGAYDFSGHDAAYCDSGSGTLVLTNYRNSNGDYSQTKVAATQIYVGEEGLNIVLKGDNVLSKGSMNSGIYFSKENSRGYFLGDGSLTAEVNCDINAIHADDTDLYFSETAKVKLSGRQGLCIKVTDGGDITLADQAELTCKAYQTSDNQDLSAITARYITMMGNAKLTAECQYNGDAIDTWGETFPDGWFTIKGCRKNEFGQPGTVQGIGNDTAPYNHEEEFRYLQITGKMVDPTKLLFQNDYTLKPEKNNIVAGVICFPVQAPLINDCITYTSSDPTIVSVAKKAGSNRLVILTGHQDGEVTLLAEGPGGVQTTCQVKVEGFHTHVFDRQLPTLTYRKTIATCSAPAQYYMSCQCGETGTESFNWGGLLAHTRGDWIVDQVETDSQEGKQHQACVKCGLVMAEKVIPALAIKEAAAGASQAQVDRFVKALKTDNDPTGTSFQFLLARQGKVTSSSISLSWKAKKDAAYYVVYGAKCGKANRYQPIATVKTCTYKQKGLKKGTYYKYLVGAFGSNGKLLGMSNTLHIGTSGGKAGNYTRVTTAAGNKKVSLAKKGKTFKLKGKAVKKSAGTKISQHRSVRYESSDPSVATVSKTGKITAKKKGTCYIYVFAQNGMYQKVKVTVKK